MMSRDKQIEEMANDHFAELGKMDKEKQIKEMAREIDKWYPNAKITNRFLSESLYNAGYRKASEVAREIFEEIEKVTEIGRIMNACAIVSLDELAELKKKYTESEKDNVK